MLLFLQQQNSNVYADVFEKNKVSLWCYSSYLVMLIGCVKTGNAFIAQHVLKYILGCIGSLCLFVVVGRTLAMAKLPFFLHISVLGLAHLNSWISSISRGGKKNWTKKNNPYSLFIFFKNWIITHSINNWHKTNLWVYINIFVVLMCRRSP